MLALRSTLNKNYRFATTLVETLFKGWGEPVFGERGQILRQKVGPGPLEELRQEDGPGGPLEVRQEDGPEPLGLSGKDTIINSKMRSRLSPPTSPQPFRVALSKDRNRKELQPPPFLPSRKELSEEVVYREALHER